VTQFEFTVLIGGLEMPGLAATYASTRRTRRLSVEPPRHRFKAARNGGSLGYFRKCLGVGESLAARSAGDKLGQGFVYPRMIECPN
jgi:hypothetical protein